MSELGINPKQAYGDKKIPIALVPPASLMYQAKACKEGARKYGPYNWRNKKVESMTYIHAAMRHILAYLDGENIDPECGVEHIGLALASLGILADATETGNLMDNRPIKGNAGQKMRDYAYPSHTETFGPLEKEGWHDWDELVPCAGCHSHVCHMTGTCIHDRLGPYRPHDRDSSDL